MRAFILFSLFFVYYTFLLPSSTGWEKCRIRNKSSSYQEHVSSEEPLYKIHKKKRYGQNHLEEPPKGVELSFKTDF